MSRKWDLFLGRGADYYTRRAITLIGRSTVRTIEVYNQSFEDHAQHADINPHEALLALEAQERSAHLLRYLGREVKLIEDSL